ncbi:MFS transporter [Sphingomonas agri]|uniref:MFS transporter n=1 Tax=Sphingomonas agri TaxID=1813878 RepID=UPI0031202D08
MATALKQPGATLLVLLLGVAVLLNYTDRGAIGIAAPLMTSELKLGPEAFGLVLSAFFWVYAPVQLVVGWLVDRFSVYRLLAAGVFLWAAATLAMGFVAGFASLLLLRILLGMGETIAFPGASKIITRHVPDDRRGMANAVLALGIALGPALGTLVGGLILATQGWRAIFIVFGAVTLLWLIPWQLAVRNWEDRAKDARGETVPVRLLLRKWPLWSMSIAHMASNYVFYFLLGWLPLFLTRSRGLPIAEMTFIATLGYTAQAVSALGLGYISDWWTRHGYGEPAVRRAMMFGGQLLAAGAVFGLAYAQSDAALALVLCVAGVATGALSLNTYAVAQMFAGPRTAGTWVGIQNAIGNLSGIFGPILTGFIVQRAGYTSACIVTAAIAAAGALWWIVGVPKIREIEFD